MNMETNICTRVSEGGLAVAVVIAVVLKVEQEVVEVEAAVQRCHP